MLIDYDKKFLKALQKRLRQTNNHRGIKPFIKEVFVKHRKNLSPAMQKFFNIRIFLSAHSLIFKHYTQSLAYKDLMNEIQSTLASKCKGCGKPILPIDKLTSINFLWKNKSCCNKHCSAKYGSKIGWDKLRKDKKFAQLRMKKIHNTMNLRYGASTTLASPELNKKVWDKRKQLYGSSGRKHHD